MSDRWTEKDVLEYAKQLKSPFEEVKQTGQGKGVLAGMAEKVKQLVNRNKGVLLQ